MAKRGSVGDSPRRLGVIDALRGIAAMYVIAYHVALMPEPDVAVPRWLGQIVGNGWSGVTLFFVLSAFTLCYTLDSRSGERRRVANFYLRRGMRIAPLYLAWLLLRLSHNSYPPTQVFASTVFIFNLWPAWREGIVLASWTLGVEVLFYAAFPLIFRVVRGVRSALLLCATTGLLAGLHYLVASRVIDASFRTPTSIYLSVFSQLPVFAIGMLLYFIYRGVSAADVERPRLAWSLLIGGVLTLAGCSFVRDDRLCMIVVYPLALAYASITLGLLLRPSFVLAHRASVFLGTISYSLYLNHPTLVFKLQPVYDAIARRELPPTFTFVIVLLVTLVPSIAFSCVTYVAIEQPFIRLGSKIIRWSNRRGSARSVNGSPLDRTDGRAATS